MREVDEGIEMFPMQETRTSLPRLSRNRKRREENNNDST
jgi:hypothetical protein